jgi:hypothetical protein
MSLRQGSRGPLEDRLGQSTAPIIVQRKENLNEIHRQWPLDSRLTVSRVRCIHLNAQGRRVLSPELGPLLRRTAVRIFAAFSTGLARLLRIIGKVTRTSSLRTTLLIAGSGFRVVLRLLSTLLTRLAADRLRNCLSGLTAWNHHFDCLP